MDYASYNAMRAGIPAATKRQPRNDARRPYPFHASNLLSADTIAALAKLCADGSTIGDTAK